MNWNPQIIPELPGPGKWTATDIHTITYTNTVTPLWPRSSTFQIKIPAGTENKVTGDIFEHDHIETITTSNITVQELLPDYYTFNIARNLWGPSPILFVSFDEMIQASQILSCISIEIEVLLGIIISRIFVVLIYLLGFKRVWSPPQLVTKDEALKNPSLDANIRYKLLQGILIK